MVSKWTRKGVIRVRKYIIDALRKICIFDVNDFAEYLLLRYLMMKKEEREEIYYEYKWHKKEIEFIENYHKSKVRRKVGESEY
jgi:hypothetical protein